LEGTATHPYSPDLVPRDAYLFNPLKEAVGGKRFTADDEVKTFCTKMAKQATTTFFERRPNEAAQAMATLYRGTGRVYKNNYWFKKELVINKFL
jgi:hypothetical protein